MLAVMLRIRSLRWIFESSCVFSFMPNCIYFWLRAGKGFVCMAVYDQGALELSSFAIALPGRWLGRLAGSLTFPR